VSTITISEYINIQKTLLKNPSYKMEEIVKLGTSSLFDVVEGLVLIFRWHSIKLADEVQTLVNLIRESHEDGICGVSKISVKGTRKQTKQKIQTN
jgi:hypothetical protein